MFEFMSYVFLLIPIIVIIRLIVDSISRKRWLKRMRESNIEDIDIMGGVEFENYLYTLFSDMGYRVETTKASGDYGADLILKRGGEKIVIQAKRYSKKVGVNAIREAYTAKTYYRCTQSWVVTNNYFTRNAIELARETNVVLIDRELLMDFIIENKNNLQEKTAKA